jgi:hypothetical protein
MPPFPNFLPSAPGADFAPGLLGSFFSPGAPSSFFEGGPWVPAALSLGGRTFTPNNHGSDHRTSARPALNFEFSPKGETP